MVFSMVDREMEIMRDSTSKGNSSRFDKFSRSGGVVRAVKLSLCAALLVAAAGAQPSADWRIDTFAGVWG